MQLTFKEKVELEQLRAIEKSQPPFLLAHQDSALMSTAESFEHWLLKRLHSRKAHPEAAEAIARPENHFRQFRISLWIIGIVLGLSSASGLLSADQQVVNVFWLLGALLGANAVTLFLWLVFIVFLKSHNSGLLASLINWGLHRIFIKRDLSSAPTASAKIWFNSLFSGSQRSWRFSVLTHSVWSAFLLGNVIGLLVVFSTQRFDFVWESTLLGDSQFHSVTQVLAWPLISVGWDAAFLQPSSSTSAESLRQSWAWFIVLCLLLYGLTPRLLALWASLWVLQYRERNWSLDFSVPYYTHLRNAYRQQQAQSNVIDEDTATASPIVEIAGFSTLRPPPEAPWHGLEVNPSHDWPNIVPNVQALLNAPEDVAKYLATIHLAQSAYVIFVEGARTVDRGLIRHLQGLRSAHMWLAVVSWADTPDEKLKAWLHAAAQAGIANERCFLVEVTA